MGLHIFPVHPELISIHIPKTAGSTFHAILQNTYGFGLKHIQTREDLHIWNNGLKYRSNKPFVKAVHGHIEAHPNWREQYANAKIIAWIRDPVERVISAYYHWKKNVNHRDDRHSLFVKSQPDLVEFAKMPEFALTVNALQTYLGRLQPREYFFIGRTEHFEEDLGRLRRLMEWKQVEVPVKNVNVQKPEVRREVKDELFAALRNEYDLYEELMQKPLKRE